MHVLACVQGLTADGLCSNVDVGAKLAYQVAVLRGAEEPASVAVNAVPTSARASTCLSYQALLKNKSLDKTGTELVLHTGRLWEEKTDLIFCVDNLGSSRCHFKMKHLLAQSSL